MSSSKKTMAASKVYNLLTADFDFNINKLRRVKSDYIEGNGNTIKEIIELVLVRKKVEFEEVPVILKNTITRYLKNNFNEEFIVRLVNKKLIPYTYLPMEDDCMDVEFIERGCKTQEQYNYLWLKINNYKSSRYSIFDEEKYIELLGKEYSKCDTIEDVLIKMNELELTRDTMTVFEMFALNLYAAKLLNKYGIDMDIKTYYIDDDMGAFGATDNKNLKLYISGFNNKIINMVNTIHHEMVHCMQTKNINENRLDRDNDIDLYIKDQILKEILGHDYYSLNYFNISFEFDAEFKASMMTAKMFDLVKINYDHDGSLTIIKKNAERMVAYADKSVNKQGYQYNFRRLYNNYLNRTFYLSMNKLRKENPDEYKEILKKYKLVRYEYNCSLNSFERKTVKEMIDDMDKGDSNEDKGIYYNLLKTRFDEDKEDRESVEEAIEDIIKASKSTKYKPVTKKILNHLVELTEKYKEYTDKYKGYFNASGGNKR